MTETAIADQPASADAVAQRTLAFLQQHRDQLRATADESEQLRRLSPDAAAILHEAGTPRMRLPRSTGGLALSLTDQMRILRTLSEIDAASAWCTMVTSNATTALAMMLPDPTFTELFAAGRPPVVAGVAAPGGHAKRIEGGYLVDGTWRFCSGIDLADWVICNTLVAGDAAEQIGIAVPKADVEVADSWNVLGLRGTGSSDFTLEGVFVPDEHLMASEPLRRWDNTRPPSDPDEHIAIALGLARRSLEELRAGFAAGIYKWREREVVQSEFSRLSIALDAVESMSFDMFEQIDRCQTELLPKDMWLRLRALGTYVTELAVECANFALRRGGGRGLYTPNPLERTLRDALAAQAHVLVSDQNYANHGASLMGLVSKQRGHR